MTRRSGGLLVAAAMAVATGAAAAEPTILAQVIARPAVQPAGQREQDQYLQMVQRLRTQCQSAASTLWQNNGYQTWRAGKSSMMHMLYSSGSYPKLPAAPEGWAEPLRGRLDASLAAANDLAKEAGTTFKELADYINAKDYQDDGFRKGDALNAKLVAAGQACHGVFAELTALHAEAAEATIAVRRGSAAKPEVVDVMIADWRRARVLSEELGRFEKADPAKLDVATKEVSSLVEERKSGFQPLKDNPDVRLKSFYATLNDGVAVKMRRFLRDATPSSFASMAKDAPRSTFWQVKGDIDVALPEHIIRAVQQMR